MTFRGTVQTHTVSPVLSQVIEQTRVVSIPLTTRNAADLTLLVPGTTTANGHGVQQGNTKQIAVGNASVAESIAVNDARSDHVPGLLVCTDARHFSRR
jgi:hypothetical protein